MLPRGRGERRACPDSETRSAVELKLKAPRMNNRGGSFLPRGQSSATRLKRRRKFFFDPRTEVVSQTTSPSLPALRMPMDGPVGKLPGVNGLFAGPRCHLIARQRPESTCPQQKCHRTYVATGHSHWDHDFTMGHPSFLLMVFFLAPTVAFPLPLTS